MPIWSEATTEFMVDMGLPVKGMRMEAVNGFPYMTVVGEGSGKAPPPRLMALAVRLVPSLRRSQRQLTAMLHERPWVEGVARWFDSERPDAIRRLRSIARVEPRDLGDADLAEHLLTCRHEWALAGRRHIALGRHDMVPVCLFVADAIEWGLDTADAFALLTGSSPASTGRSDELADLRRALAGRAVGSFDELRALGPEVAELFDVFIETHGWRLVDGYDVDGPCLAELPPLLLRTVTDDAAEAGGADVAGRDQLAGEMRGRIPVEQREAFDVGLADARASYGLREDNGHILVSWPTGLLRRAMLAAGERLAANDELEEPSLAIEATPEELAAALGGAGGLDADALRSRAQHRAHWRSSDAPPTLGPPAAPPPRGLPGAMGKVLRAFDVADIANTPSATPLTGTGIGDLSYEGTARLVPGGGAGIDEFQPGDVLVAPMTAPSYNHLLAMAGALVTDAGGILSHAAIMARELGLPAVIGATEATSRIRDGDIVLVDPRTGTVTITTRTHQHREASTP